MQLQSSLFDKCKSVKEVWEREEEREKEKKRNFSKDWSKCNRCIGKMFALSHFCLLFSRFIRPFVIFFIYLFIPTRGCYKLYITYYKSIFSINWLMVVRKITNLFQSLFGKFIIVNLVFFKHENMKNSTFLFFS